MSDNGAIQKIRAKVYYRLSEIILAALLTVAISFFAYGMSTQAKLAARQRECEKEVALNAQSIDAINENMKSNQAATLKHLDVILERVDQRCDALESILNIIAKRGETGGE